MSGWRDQAACLDAEPEWFFPVRENDPAEQAKAVCSTCPVAAECLAWAYEIRDGWAVLGGMTAAEREAKRRAVLRGRPGMSRHEQRESRAMLYRELRTLIVTGSTPVEAAAAVGKTVGQCEYACRRAGDRALAGAFERLTRTARQRNAS